MDNKIPPNNGSWGEHKDPPQGYHQSGPINRLNLTPTHMLAITLVGLFLAEVVAMIVIFYLGTMSYIWQTVVDALIMVAIIFPVLYFLSFRPLLAYLHQFEQALAELRELQLELEQRVEQRTADLHQVNRSLEKEIAEREQSEAKVQSLAKFPGENPNPILRISKEGKVLYANPPSIGLLQEWNCAVGELIPGNWRQVISATLDTDRLQEQELLCGERIFSLVITPIMNDDYVNIYGSDITERKRAETALRESEELLRLAYDAADLGIWRHDLLTGRIRPDERTRSHYGFDAEEGTLDDLFTRVHPDDFARLEQEIAATRDPASSGRFRTEYRLFHPDGGVRWLSVQAQTQFAGEGDERHAVQVIGTSREITKFKQAEQSLIDAHDELDRRVQQRTAELAEVNEELMIEIAERERATAELRLVSAALEAAANGIIITGRRGNIRWANPAFTTMTGFSQEEVIGQNPSILKSGKHTDEFYQDLWETITSGKVWRGEIINRRKDGTLYTEEQTITPLVDEKGEITHFIAIKQDITERKQAEQALRQSEVLLQKVLETLPIGVWITDASGNLMQGNPESRRIWQGARFVGIDQYGEYKGWWLDSGERIEPEQWAAARAVTRGETSLNEEIEIECFDGSHKIIFNSAVPILDERNVVQGVIVVNQDITERKQAEESIHLERSKLRNILDTMPEGICIIGQKYDIEYINPSLEREFGQVGKRKCYDYFNNRTEVCDWCVNERVFTGESFTLEWYSSKTAKTYDLFDTPLVNPDGSISKLEIFHDITERKRTEEQLAHQNKELLDLTNTERKQREIIETVCAAAQSLTQSLKLESVVNTLLAYIDKIIPFDTASVAVMEEEARLAVCAVRGNEHWTNFSALLVEEYPTNSIAQKLLSSRQSLLIPDLAGHPDWKMNAEAAYIRSWLGVPIVSGEKAFGVVWLGKCEAEFFTPEHAQWAEAMVDQAGVAIQNAWLFEQVQSNSERLQYLSHRLVDAQENELRYIAQELHDEVGQAITSLMVGLHRIQEEADKPEVIRAESARLDQVMDNVMENLHRLAMDLRPASLDRLGLRAALDQHIEILQEKLSLDIQFEMVGVDERLPANLEIALFRIVQEALNNVARHAQATQADVLLHKRNGNLVLIIEDNGAGFDPEVAMKGNRLGLVGMRERAEMLGGKLIIESSPSVGTTIWVEVPYENSNSDRG